jgi:hypothetical protein
MSETESVTVCGKYRMKDREKQKRKPESNRINEIHIVARKSFIPFCARRIFLVGLSQKKIKGGNFAVVWSETLSTDLVYFFVR